MRRWQANGKIERTFAGTIHLFASGWSKTSLTDRLEVIFALGEATEADSEPPSADANRQGDCASLSSTVCL